LGIDRFVMLFGGLNNIRDCIAFPKTQKATDLMTEAPGPVDAKQLRELGTDMLTIGAGTSFTSDEAKLPEDSVDMVARLEQVNAVSAIGQISGTYVYRNEAIDPNQTNALAVYAAAFTGIASG
jgi:hypothetical protein